MMCLKALITRNFILEFQGWLSEKMILAVRSGRCMGLTLPEAQDQVGDPESHSCTGPEAGKVMAI